MKRQFLLTCIVILLAAFAAPSLASDDCADALGCVEIGPEDSIVFGGILRLSGPPALDRRGRPRRLSSGGSGARWGAARPPN